MISATVSRRYRDTQHVRRGVRWDVWGALLSFLVLMASPLAAADGDGNEKEPPPEPRNIDLLTKDKVLLRATYYEGTEGKETVPVILLHMYKGKRSDYRDLALFLQSIGHAVLVPDLRGHGESTEIEGSKRPLKAARLPANQYPRMVEYDMEACKAFLVKENNKGKLNIEKLCVVGAEMGAEVAVNWAWLDWNWPPLAIGKQGQDVSGLVLISPQWAFKTLRINRALADENIRSKLSVYILVGGEDSKSLSNANRVYKAFKPHHPKPTKENASQRDLFYQVYGVSLQGTKLLGTGLGVGENIAKFIERRLVNQDTPWKKRESPLGQ